MERPAPRPDEFDFGESDALVDWARRHGKRVRGHTLVWDQQLPPWLTRREWSRAELADALRRHVGTVVRRYRGRIESWDVVNEPFEDDGSWTQNLWHRVLGPEYVRIALGAARRADPDARLFVNEIAAEAPGPKQDALVRLTGDLRRRGIPLDGVGLQNHTDAAGAPDAATLTRALRRLAAGGLDVEITEMDVVKDPGGPRAQAAAFAAAAGACRAVPRCTGLTVWGVTDGESWLGAAAAPLLFDRAGRAKPALPALRKAWRGDGGR